MSDRYERFRETFEIDYPAERVLRLTLNKPETLNSLDQTGHRNMTYIWNEIDQDPDVSAVILTAKGQREDKERALSTGADLFISKPFSNADLISAVETLANGRPGTAA